MLEGPARNSSEGWYRVELQRGPAESFIIFVIFFFSTFNSQLVELCTQIAGACLEQTTWLRRNLAVRDNSPLVNTGVLANTILFGKDADKNSKYTRIW